MEASFTAVMSASSIVVRVTAVTLTGRDWASAGSFWAVTVTGGRRVGSLVASTVEDGAPAADSRATKAIERKAPAPMPPRFEASEVPFVQEGSRLAGTIARSRRGGA